MPEKRIYIWSDKREKSYHQVYIVRDYKLKLERMGNSVKVNQTNDWNEIYEEVCNFKPNLFILHGGKIFPPDLARKIYKRFSIYLRWRWHPDPPKVLIDNCTIASKVSFVKNTYGGKLYYSPHPAITTYFNQDLQKFKRLSGQENKYSSDIIFVGLAGNRGKGFYKKRGRNKILESPMVRYLNKEMFGTGDKGFYEYPEIAKYYSFAKLGLSVSSFDDEINFRVFNLMACGTPVISDSTEAMNRFFTPGFHYISYKRNDLKDFEKVARHYLENNEARKKIAENGLHEIMKKHKSSHRLREMLDKAL